MRPITKRQSEALTFIESHLAAHPYAPSLREIADGLGLKSTSPAKSLVDGLAAKGYLTYEAGSHRSIVVTK